MLPTNVQVKHVAGNIHSGDIQEWLTLLTINVTIRQFKAINCDSTAQLLSGQTYIYTFSDKTELFSNCITNNLIVLFLCT